MFDFFLTHTLDFRFQRNDSVSNSYFLSLFLVIVAEASARDFRLAVRRAFFSYFLTLLQNRKAQDKAVCCLVNPRRFFVQQEKE